VSPEIYDRFVESVRDTKYAAFDRAMLTLFHPTQAATGDALRFVLGLTKSKDIARYTSTPTKRHFMVKMVLRLAHLLIGNGQLSDAHKVLQFAQIHFPTELNIQETNRVAEKQKAIAKISELERAHLRSLDALLAT
jgi:hypothetical protein